MSINRDALYLHGYSFPIAFRPTIYRDSTSGGLPYDSPWRPKGRLSSSTTSIRTTGLTRTEREEFTPSTQSRNMMLTQPSHKKAFMQRHGDTVARNRRSNDLLVLVVFPMRVDRIEIGSRHRCRRITTTKTCCGKNPWMSSMKPSAWSHGPQHAQ